MRKRDDDILPPHANAEPHRRLMEAVTNATPEEIRAGLIRAGIMTEDGKLAEHYRVPRRRRKARKPVARRARKKTQR